MEKSELFAFISLIALIVGVFCQDIILCIMAIYIIICAVGLKIERQQP